MHYVTACPINERTADGIPVGRCWHGLVNGVCVRHGDVSPEVERYMATGKTTDENVMRRRKGLTEFHKAKERQSGKTSQGSERRTEF